MSSKYKIEFLLLKVEDTKCNSIATLKNLLSSDGDVSFNRHKIKVGRVEVNFKATTDLIEDTKDERYFHFTLEKEYEEKDEEKTVDELLLVFKKLKRIVLESGKVFRIAPLWDDTSLYFAKQAYPLIFEVENLMRKLIYQFMLMKLGSSWFKRAVPEEFKKNVSKNDRETNDLFEAVLYNADFIHVISFLFGKYTTDSNRIVEKISRMKTNSEIDLDELKQLVPQDNWTRYFQPIIKDDKFKDKWEKLYLLRCKVAHNTLISNGEYEDIKALSKELKEKLISAISMSNSIKMEEESKDEFSRSALNSFSEILRNSGSGTFKLSETMKSITGLDLAAQKFVLPSGLGLASGSVSGISNQYLFPTKVCINCGKPFEPKGISISTFQSICDACREKGIGVIFAPNSGIK